MNRCYSELSRLNTFEERFEYLVLGGGVANETFGSARHLNQQFYASLEWKSVRDYVISRDNGCDLGIPGYEIFADLLIHHINPMSPEDIIHGEIWILDPEFLITTTHTTHNAIHYSSKNLIPKVVAERTPNDTRLW